MGNTEPMSIDEIKEQISIVNDEIKPLKKMLDAKQATLRVLISKKYALEKSTVVGKYFKKVTEFSKEDVTTQLFHILKADIEKEGTSLRLYVNCLEVNECGNEKTIRLHRNLDIRYVQLGVNPEEITMKEFNDVVNESVGELVTWKE